MADSKEGFAAVIERLMSLDDGQDRRRWLRYAGIIPASSADFKNISNDMFLFMNEVNKYNQNQPNKDKQISHPMAAMQRHMPVLSYLAGFKQEAKGTNFAANVDSYWPKDATVTFNDRDSPEAIRQEGVGSYGYYAPTWNENKVTVKPDARVETLLHELQHVKYKRNTEEKIPVSSMFGLVKSNEDRWYNDYYKNKVVNTKRKKGEGFSPNSMDSLNEWLANVRAMNGVAPEGTPMSYPGLTDAEALHLQNYYK